MPYAKAFLDNSSFKCTLILQRWPGSLRDTAGPSRDHAHLSHRRVRKSLEAEV